MERFNARRTFVFMLKKTSFTLGLMLGLAFAVPLFFGRYIGDEYQLLTLPIVFAVLFGGTVLCGRWAERKLNALLKILYDDCDPERFFAQFTKELYSRRSEEWRGAVLEFVAQAYHAQGRYKEEETLYLQFLNNTRRKNPDDLEDCAILGRLTMLYGDAQNAAGAQKAFAKFKEKVLNVPSGVIGITGSNFDLFKDAVYNSYLMGTGRFDECVGFFEWVCENPSDELAFLASHYRLAEVYRTLGSSDEAEREYRTVAESDKDIYAVRMAKQRLAENGL